MTREERYHVLKMLGSGIGTAIVYLSSHNFKQTPPPSVILPQDLMLYLEAFAAALGAMGLYLAHSPLDMGKVTPAKGAADPPTNSEDPQKVDAP